MLSGIGWAHCGLVMASFKLFFYIFLGELFESIMDVKSCSTGNMDPQEENVP